MVREWLSTEVMDFAQSEEEPTCLEVRQRLRSAKSPLWFTVWTLLLKVWMVFLTSVLVVVSSGHSLSD